MPAWPCFLALAHDQWQCACWRAMCAPVPRPQGTDGPAQCGCGSSLPPLRHALRGRAAHGRRLEPARLAPGGLASVSQERCISRRARALGPGGEEHQWPCDGEAQGDGRCATVGQMVGRTRACAGGGRAGGLPWRWHREGGRGFGLGKTSLMRDFGPCGGKWASGGGGELGCGGTFGSK